MLAEGATTPERAVEIDVDDVEPMLVGDRLRRCLASRNARIIDQDIDPAVADASSSATSETRRESVTSMMAISASRPLAFKLAQPVSAILGSRSAITTFAPASASASAQASPIPWPAPVTRAVFRSSLNFSRYIFLLFLFA